MARFTSGALTAWLRVHRSRLLFVGLAVALAPFVLVIGLAIVTPFPSELDAPPPASLRVLSRNGELLREVRADDGSRSRPLASEEYPRLVRDAVLAAEDRRFYQHHGVDLLAVARALVTDLAHRHVVSGASTLTMQLARNLRPHRRTLWGKVEEAALALRIEARLPKDRILVEYLNRVPYGPNLRGFAAASQAYFSAPPAALSVAQAALVAGLPRGPSIYDVRRHAELAKRRRDRVLLRMKENGNLDDAALSRALDEPVSTSLPRPAFGAPHFVRALLQGKLANEQPGLAAALQQQAALEVVTTIDPEIQRAAETAVARAVHDLADQHVTAAATVVVDNRTGDVLAYVGSPDFFDEDALGQNDGVLALRQPGSSLKPFVYAEAMESLGFTGATILPDVELHIPLPGGGDYVPHDYDTHLRGPVRLREALGNSLNVPAVWTLYQLGTARVLDRLHAMGFASLTGTAETYGPALALGDGEVVLLEIARAYAALARGGIAKPLRFVTHVTHASPAGAASGADGAGADVLAGDAPREDFPPAKETRVLGEKTALLLGDILSDKGARLAAFGDQNVLELDYDVAAKTGTSKGYRDNVAAGFTRSVTVAAWVGNFDGSSMKEVSGIAGAGTIFHAVMEAAMQHRPHDSLSLATAAERLGLERAPVCPLSGMVATTACPHHVDEWLESGETYHAPPCTVHELVRLNVHDGLRAGPGCPDNAVETRVFERWAAPFDAWGRDTGRPLVPESSPECPATSESEAGGTPTGDGDGGAAGDPRATGPRIVYPFDGSHFVLDPERPPQRQTLEIRVDNGGAPVAVTVDGAPLAAPYAWPLVVGRHEIVARDGNRTARAVVIHVR